MTLRSASVVRSRNWRIFDIGCQALYMAHGLYKTLVYLFGEGFGRAGMQFLHRLPKRLVFYRRDARIILGK